MSDAEWQAISLSLQVALVATAMSLPVGIATAWVLARYRFAGKWLLDGLVHLPLVMPPVVTGYLLLIALGRNGFLGKPLFEWTGLSFSFNWMGAALASAIMGFPLMVRAIRLAFELIDPRLERAANTLGATPMKVFFTISVPMAMPGLIAGAVLAFAKSLGEFGATITFVSSIPGETETIPAAIYGLLQVPGGDAGALRLTAIAVVLALGALVASEWLSRRMRRRLQR